MLTNPRLLALALGNFAVGTGTYSVTGLLGDIARSLSVSTAAAGQLVTVFAIAYAVSSPVLVAMMGRVGRRRLLVVSAAAFALANLAAAASPSFGILLALRVIAAASAAIFTPVAVAVGSGLVASERRGEALSVVMGGLTVSWVFGLPLGTLIGDHAGWRASFVTVAALGGLAAAGVGVFLPALDGREAMSLRSRLAVAKNPAIVAALLLTAVGLSASFTVLTYIRPLLEELTGFGGEGVVGMLLLFGLAGIAGTALGGSCSDRIGPGKFLATVLVVLGFSLLLLSLLSETSGSPFAVFGTAGALVAWGAAGFAIPPLQQYRLIGMAPDSSEEVLSLNASAIYVGQGFGAALGALTLGYGSLTSLGWTGAGCSAASLLLLAVGMHIERRAPVESAPESPPLSHGSTRS